MLAALTFYTSIYQLILIGLIVLLSQFIYAAIGFGSGMIAISLYAIIYGNIDVFVPFFLLLCVPIELYISFKERKNIAIKEIIHLSVYMIPPLILGVYLLKNFSGEGIVYILGFIIAGLAIFYLFFEERIEFSFKSRLWLPLFGSLSGILGSLFGIAGPPLIIYYKSKKVNKGQFRLMLLSMFLFMSIVRIITYFGFGIYTKKILISIIPVLPFSLFGLLLGNFAHTKVSEKVFKKITSVVLLISGIILVLK